VEVEVEACVVEECSEGSVEWDWDSDWDCIIWVDDDDEAEDESEAEDEAKAEDERANDRGVAGCVDDMMKDEFCLGLTNGMIE